MIERGILGTNAVAAPRAMRTSRSTEVGGGVMVRVSNATPVSVTRNTFKYHAEILDINANFEHCAHAGRNGKSLLFL